MFITMELGADGTGCTSGISCDSPAEMLTAMVEALVKAHKERVRQNGCKTEQLSLDTKQEDVFRYYSSAKKKRSKIREFRWSMCHHDPTYDVFSDF